ncbi:MAG: hypothetical protein AB7Y46_00645, partial [Armatimonadota bacterium]
AVAVLVLAHETVLVLAFVLGYRWLEWRGGLAVCGVVLLATMLPWFGELRIWFDSAGPAGTVKLSWWGRFSFRMLPDATELRARFLVIPWRRRLERKPREAPEPAARPQVRIAEAPGEAEGAEKPPYKAVLRRRAGRVADLLRHADADSVEALSRIIAASLQALNELTWGAAEIAVRIDNAAQHETADRTIERIVGHREVGPIDLMTAASGARRRVRLRYRIAMLRVALVALQLVADGRAFALAKAIKQKRRAENEARDPDQTLIARIIEEREDDRNV